MIWKHKEPVVLLWVVGKKAQEIHTQIDCCGETRGEFGYVCVAGWPGMAGPVSVQTKLLRKK